MGWECEISIISRGAQFHVSAGRTYTLDLLAQTSSILYCALLVDSIPIPRPPLALSITAGGRRVRSGENEMMVFRLDLRSADK